MALPTKAHFLQPTALQHAFPAIVGAVAPAALGRQDAHVIAAAEVPIVEPNVLPSGNQTWLAQKSPRNGGVDRNINDKWSIFHCHV